ncbi:MAG TPA: outer membrane beta-barrel protein [Vicinamibacterales bacterium]|jgi:hypothetical protein|nr:outer membrane beta-barrel protein [Vicinamibacterales bacterium]
MQSNWTRPVRRAAIVTGVLGGLLSLPAPLSAQGLGVGARLAWVTADSDTDADSRRVVGGQIRLLSPRFGLELSLDRRSESFEALNQKATETPIQASLLMRLSSSRISPFLLGGPGWYRRTIEPLEGSGPTVTSTEFGWHAGGGLELLLHRHFGLHGDYRFTFLDFGDDDEEDDGILGGVLPGHRGSMWTVGASFYF